MSRPEITVNSNVVICSFLISWYIEYKAYSKYKGDACFVLRYFSVELWDTDCFDQEQCQTQMESTLTTT